MKRRILTLGYEGIPADGFVALLKRSGVERVVDVREVPLSRKPGFSKTALKARLEAAGIDYVHKVQFGCPKPVRDAYRESGDWTKYTRGFMRHLSKQGVSIAELANEASKVTSCLICYEADYTMCHRSMVAEAVAAQSKLKIEHLTIQTDRAVVKRAA